MGGICEVPFELPVCIHQQLMQTNFMYTPCFSSVVPGVFPREVGHLQTAARYLHACSQIEVQSFGMRGGDWEWELQKQRE